MYNVYVCTVSYRITTPAFNPYLDLYGFRLADPSGVRLPVVGTEACAHDVDGCQDGGYEECRPVCIRKRISTCLLRVLSVSETYHASAPTTTPATMASHGPHRIKRP